ncbi:MAG: NGG1p interacting factor NIF3 [Clostridia bacterium]|nr:NGG1p interacting factor NIF3 [Clostridia bacterium]
MKLRQIYEMAFTMGMQADPRGMEMVKKDLLEKEKEYDGLTAKGKPYFDMESLKNPYSDTRILAGNGNEEVKSVMMGIDMEVGEVLLADRLKEKGRSVDLLISHHPEGSALAALSKVMPIQSGMMYKNGVLPNVAQAIMEDRISEVDRGIAALNHQRSVAAAKLLKQPFMCVHTPADNMVTDFVAKHLAKAKPDKLQDLVEALLEIPEYHISAVNNNAPTIITGSKKTPVGKIYVDFTGGTGGADENYRKLCDAGISTVIAMHAGEKKITVAKDCHLNLVIAGHIASDSIGCNIFLDALEKQGIEIIPISGLIRVSRN